MITLTTFKRAAAVLIIALAATLASGPAYAEPVPQLDSILIVPMGDKTCFFHLTAEMLHKAPAWPQSAEQPPLPARKALNQGTALFHELCAKTKLKDTLPRGHWSSSLQLTPSLLAERWYWVVVFDFQPLEPRQRGLLVKVPVLMDGLAVVPEILDNLPNDKKILCPE